jgi:ribosome-associated translation inhibitor RaiA
MQYKLLFSVSADCTLWIPLIGLFIICFLSSIVKAQVTIAFDINNKPVSFGVTRIEEALNKSGRQVRKINSSSNSTNANIIIQVLVAKELSSIQKEGFEIAYRNKTLTISATDTAGAMYGALDVAEQIRMGKTWQTISSKKVNPHFTVRALKFNLPWSSYRVGPAMDQHLRGV